MAGHNIPNHRDFVVISPIFRYMKARGWKHAASPGKDGRPEMAYRDEMASQASKYRGQEAKRREYNEHKDTGYNAGGGRRRYDHAPSDMFRRQYGTDERVRHGRYPEREYSTESRDTRAQRGDWRSYDYDEDANYYGEARGYRGGRYDDNAKYRKSGQQYENRDRFGRGDRYDRHRRSERSYSPQTPPSDRRSPNPKRVHNAAPPPPPHEMVEGFKGGENAYSKHSRSVTGQHNGKGPAYTNDGSHSYSKHRGDVKPAEKSSQNDVKVSDPRSGRNLYISRLTTELDIVKLPRVAPADASLASPPFQMNLSWDHLKPNFNVFQTPLERINMHMCAPKPQITQEWWLKGTLSLLMMGIPRQWQVNEVLSHIMDAYDRILNWDEMIFDKVKQDEGSIDQHNMKRHQVEWCRKIGLQKFVLLFGNNGVAVNGIPFQFPRNMDFNSGPVSHGRAPSNTNEHPDAMGLMIFESEPQALQFWTSMSSNCIKAYPSTIMVCPDPSGWRIYTEALSLWFQGDAILQTVSSGAGTNPAKDRHAEDLLPVLTHKTPEEPTQKQKPVSQLTFIAPFVANPTDAVAISNALTNMGIRCMYHKPSKIMSLQFPSETLFSSLAVGHRYFIAPSGSRVHCCYIRCIGKLLPIVKRINVEHISNAVEKNKGTPPKPSKFKPPTVGIISFDTKRVQ